MFIAAAGRIPVQQLLVTTRLIAAANNAIGGWGIAYSYGNRLESTRSLQPITTDTEWSRAAGLRTDMVLLCLMPAGQAATVREVRPFIRHETDRVWAFGHCGDALDTEKLDTGGRIADSHNPMERVFSHLLSKLDIDDPVGSVTGALGSLTLAGPLSLCLLSCDLMIVANWMQPDRPDPTSESRTLWLGHGDMVRYVSSEPLRALPESSWESLAPQTVMAVSRVRHELP